MMNIFTRISILLILVGLSVTANGQTCTQKLNQAEDDYEAGRLTRIPSLLNECLTSRSFSKEEEIRARKLLTLVYLFTDQEDKTETAMIELLKADPEHRLDQQVDPAEMFFLYDQFRTAPIFRVSLKGGFNFSQPYVLSNSGTQNTNDVTVFYNGKTPDGQKSYTYTYEGESQELKAVSGQGLGVWGEVMVERHVGKGIELGLGVQGRGSNYKVDAYLNQSDIRTSVTNRQFYMRAPLMVRYTLNYNNRDQKLLPYIMAGGSLDYLMSAQYLNASRVGGTTYSTSGNTDLIAEDLVNRFNYSFFGGLGVKIRSKTNLITLEARYDMSRLNYINGQNRYTNEQNTFDLAYVESDVVLNYLSFSIGYVKSIYNPKKIR